MESGKVYVYSRYSIDDQKRIDKQVNRCKEFIASHYGEDEAQEAIVYRAVAESGNPENSPVMRKMLEQLKAGDMVFATNVDRMGKEPQKTCNMLKQYVDDGVTFVFTDQKKGEKHSDLVIDANTRWNDIRCGLLMGEMIIGAESEAPMESPHDDMDVLQAMIENVDEPDEYDAQVMGEWLERMHNKCSGFSSANKGNE